MPVQWKDPTYCDMAVSVKGVSGCAPGLLALVTVLIASQWTYRSLTDGEAGRAVQGLL